MRAGFFTEVYHPVVNGVVASIDALARGLHALGHEVYCFAPSVPGHEDAAERVYRIPSLPLPVQAPYRLTVPVVSRRKRETVINRLHVIHAHSPFVTGWMALRYARRLRVPLVYTYHTRLEEYAHYVPFEPHATRRAAETLTRSYANSADAVIVPSLAMRERLTELGVTVPIEVIPSGIDVEFFASGKRSAEIRRSFGASNGDVLLLTVSRLAREKNVELLIDAVARSRGARLVIAGEGPHRAALEALTKKCGVASRVHFAGEVARERLPEMYASADAFVFASQTETQGLVLAEAVAAGLPVFAADAPPVSDVLSGTGRILPADAAAFAAAIADFHAVDEAERRRIGQSAERFGAEHQARRVAAVYQDLTRTYVRCTIDL